MEDSRNKNRVSGSAKISLTAVGDFLRLAVIDFFADNGPQWAAAIAYYSLLSLFPILLAVTSIGAYFVNVDWIIQQVTELLEGFIPEGISQIEEIIREAYDARGSVGILSILALLWSGSRVFGTVARAMNVAFDSQDHYGVIKRTLVEILMLLTLGLLLIFALASRFLLELFTQTLDLMPENQNFIYRIAMEAIPPILLFIVFVLIYRFVPRKSVNWTAALVGGVVSILLFLLARPLFQNYVQQFANYNLIYGSIAIVIIIIFWAWVMAMIILFGGEITSHYEAMIVNNLSAEELEKKR